ncbi:hypothetical protein BD626DRAFT_483722 [Schizophyllum amplum]|uniref:Secreted protein n=1 Tax=Schizophyllum amplum TaxID=97359 RepID=A0A550CPN1_9AGAR|nr:hypothetical protein BD626DRAFT_483722 [Auriculariopsis ampla]
MLCALLRTVHWCLTRLVSTSWAFLVSRISCLVGSQTTPRSSWSFVHASFILRTSVVLRLPAMQWAEEWQAAWSASLDPDRLRLKTQR